MGFLTRRSEHTKRDDTMRSDSLSNDTKNETNVSLDEKAGSNSQSEPLQDEQTVKRITRKFDFHILPWLFGLWLLAFIDRSNIGLAAIDGLQDQVAPGTQFNTALAVFYVPYILVDVPSNWVLKYFKAGLYLPFLITGWGLVSLCTGFVTNFGGLVAARFFLGLFEGGLLGGIILYLSMFYKRHQMMIRIGLFYCAAPLSGAFGGLLATGLSRIKTADYDEGWPFIFFIEGTITVVFGIACAFFLPHTPEDARFLSQEDKASATAILRADFHDSKQISDDQAVEEDKFSWHWVKLALLNWNTVLLSLNFFAIITPIYSFSLFLPTIIEALGYTNLVTAQLFTVPPNIGGFFTVLIVAFVSDKVKHRGLFMLGGALIAIGGYIMLLASRDPYVQYGGTFLVAAGIFPCSPLVMAWLANNVHPHYVRATATGFQIGVANLAAFIATFTYLPKDAPRYVVGHSINLGVLCLSVILTITLLLYQRWENRKRDRGERDYRLSDGDEKLLGQRHPSFRYTL